MKQNEGSFGFIPRGVYIEGDNLIIPGIDLPIEDTIEQWHMVDVAEDPAKNITMENQNALVEFMRIRNEDDLISFTEKRGVIAESVSHFFTEVAFINWIHKLCRFLKEGIREGENIFPSEEVIQHYTDFYSEPDEDDYAEMITNTATMLLAKESASERLCYAIKKLQAQEPRSVDSNDGNYSLPSPASVFAKDIVNSTARKTCRKVLWIPEVNRDGEMRWKLEEKDLLHRLYYEFFNTINPCLIDRCKECGKAFLKSREGHEYCSKACVKRVNMRAYRERERAGRPKSPRGRKRIERDDI